VDGRPAGSLGKDFDTGPLTKVACAAPTACMATAYAPDLSQGGFVPIADGAFGTPLASQFDPLAIAYTGTAYLTSGTIQVQDKNSGQYYFLGALVTYPRPAG
jgi:hypothetical protein